MSKVPHFGDRPVFGWRYDPGERDCLSFALGVAQRARRPVARKAPAKKTTPAPLSPAATTRLGCPDGMWCSCAPGVHAGETP